MDTKRSDRWTPEPLRFRGAAVLGMAVVMCMAAACASGDEADVFEESPEVQSMLDTPEPPSEATLDLVPDTLVESMLDTPMEDTQVEGRILVLWRSAEDPPELVVEAEGLQTGDHAWDLHAGSCTAPGPVALALSETSDSEGVVGPLRVDQTGMVELTVEIPELAGMVPSEGRYTLHIHDGPGIVHAEGSDGPTTVACARL